MQKDDTGHAAPPAGLPPEPRYQTVGACEIEVPRPCGVVIFGATGDLAHRKLIPALFQLQRNNVLPAQFFILGAGRGELTAAVFRDSVQAALRAASPGPFPERSWEDFSKRLFYQRVEYASPQSYTGPLHDSLAALEKQHRTGGNRIFYLAVPPSQFESIVLNLGTAGLSQEDGAFRSVVIEKPFGRDLESARRLNHILHQSFAERQIFRIDHYLAKETVQSMLMFRFANAVFEPLWNRRYIDHVQITAAETLGVEHRAGYYEEAGVIRDMFQNHMFQLLSMTAMEPPPAFRADLVWDEKVKVFRSLRPFPLDRLAEHVVIGQYGAGAINGATVPAYREEPGVSPDSRVPTFAAMKIFIDNWRWNGVPFYLRSGKRLGARRTEIAIHFKPVPHLMFSNVMNEPIDPNVLVFRLQPDEGISLSFQTKMPGSKVCLRPVEMAFSHRNDVFRDAYEWVLLDCIYGDHLLFQREDGVELTWSFLMPVMERLDAASGAGMLSPYPAGSTGPAGAAALIERDHRSWRPL